MPEFFISIYNFFLYNPITGLMMFFYKNTGNNLGFAIILLTIAVKLILMPFERKSLKSQKEIAELQPKINEIQKRYKDDKEKQALELMDLYKNANINPFASFSLLILQLPILITLYQAIREAATNPEINTIFLGIVSLKDPYLPLTLLVAVVQYFQISFSMSKSQKKAQGWMALFSPALMFFILLKFPSSISLYIIVSSVFTILEQYFINKAHKEKHE
ncbi:MAG TPA: YidC/Oxa1 family membrane protein insertase [Candidatus Pacearchaeota archaeon]|nr:membrane protein insertase YidC [Candidatus Parcubacteria bacterium]HOU45637.1 YidC/Oxa1 family membrane protein insertase [Candidatus Pacearchaeota archaeon]HPM08301.1 YidC/Oxa1 family membrane protein insertase [Candidatus Pacearchaeota archaeon]HQI74566.1 YidC/Oxa1 family membrane protein insertase [Candidatus Pacearchaeota archaeon]